MIIKSAFSLHVWLIPQFLDDKPLKNVKSLKTAKKVFQQAFGCVQQPKLVEIHISYPCLHGSFKVLTGRNTYFEWKDIHWFYRIQYWRSGWHLSKKLMNLRAINLCLDKVILSFLEVLLCLSNNKTCLQRISRPVEQVLVLWGIGVGAKSLVVKA